VRVLIEPEGYRSNYVNENTALRTKHEMNSLRYYNSTVSAPKNM
jgi:hypothetical protein